MTLGKDLGKKLLKILFLSNGSMRSDVREYLKALSWPGNHHFQLDILKY